MDYSKLDLLSPEVGANPPAYYKWLRENDPVHWTAAGFWMVTRYEDVLAVYKDTETFSSEGLALATNKAEFETPVLAGTMITTDGERHNRLRAIANKVFNPRVISGLRPWVLEIADRLLRQVEHRGEMDVIKDLAVPLPVEVIAVMMGVETSRLEQFKHWSDTLVDSIRVDLTEERRAEVRQELGQLQEYFREKIQERTAHPEEDLISALALAEEDHKRLSPDELVSTLVLVLVAGNETTTNLIGNTFVALCQHPDAMKLLANDPSLVPQLVEEGLRFTTPVQGLFRLATRDTEIAGVKIKKGQLVHALHASANRDESVFPDGDRFDPLRDNMKQIAFGYGVHHCLGAPLARLEARVLFEQVFLRLQNIRLKGGELTRLQPFFVLGGYKSIPITFDAAPTPARKAS